MNDPAANTRTYAAAWVIALLVALCAGAAYRGGPGANPIRSVTTPPSQYERGLVVTPNPLSDGCNSVITGNVRGGKHFRGNVPYRSTTDFGGMLGSTSLDSFLRYSAIPQELGVTSRSTGGFYSPTGTVTTMPPGYNRVFAPTSARVARGAGQLHTEVPRDVLDVPEIPQPQLSVWDRGTALETNWRDWERLRSWPLSPVERDVPYGDNEAEGSLVGPRASLPQDQPVVSDARRRELVPSGYRPSDVQTSATRLEQTLGLDEYAAREPSARASAEALEDSDRLRRLFDTSASLPDRTPWPTRPASVEQSREEAGPGTETVSPEQPGLELYRPTADLAARLAPESADHTDSLDALFLSSRTGQATGEVAALPAVQRIEETSAALDAARDLLQRPIGSKTPPKETKPQRGLHRLGSSDGDSNADQIATILARWRTGPPQDTRNVAGLGIAQRGDAPSVSTSQSPDPMHAPYEHAGLFLAERYGRYMAAAEQYLRQGRYYRAAECFTLASLSRPSDAIARLGKAHALFAAGDYFSSAIALAEAIDRDPRRALKRRDLTSAIGEPGELEARLADLDDCVEGRDVPLLQFLAAYVRYQIGDLAGAKTALEAAARGLPSFPALDPLHAAIGQ